MNGLKRFMIHGSLGILAWFFVNNCVVDIVFKDWFIIEIIVLISTIFGTFIIQKLNLNPIQEPTSKE